MSDNRRLINIIWTDEIPGSLWPFLPCLGNELRARRPQASSGIIRMRIWDFTTNHDHNPTRTMDKLEEIPDITRVRVRPIQHR
jgi:hypothetical protein